MIFLKRVNFAGQFYATFHHTLRSIELCPTILHCPISLCPTILLSTIHYALGHSEHYSRYTMPLMLNMLNEHAQL